MEKERIFFVEDLCDDREDMKKKMDIEQLIGNHAVIVEGLEEVPNGSIYYNGIYLQVKDNHY